MILEPVSRRGRSRRLRALAAVLAAAALAAALAAGWAWTQRDRMPDGTRVAGLELGGLTRGEARAALVRRARALAARPLEVSAAGTALSTSGAALGAEPLLDAALDEALAVAPLDRLRARLGLGGGRELALAFRLDRQRVGALADELDGRVGSPPEDAAVVVGVAGVRVTEAVPGELVDRDELAGRLRGLPARVAAPVRLVPPTVQTHVAEAAAARVERLLDAPRRVARAGVSATLAPRVLRRLVQVEPDGGRLAVTLDEEGLVRRLRPAFRDRERPARDAGFRVDGVRVTVVPAREGRALDGAAIAASLLRNLASTVHRARFAEVAPARTTEAARALRITRLVSEFTTYYPCCEPRVTNIRLAAELLDGTVLEPGGTFSMNETLGKRTEERGFVSAPQIFAGRLEDAVGGGISQVATTLYNAAFFAGLRLDAHSPHQFYIDRYPLGREATVSWGGPELVFTNDWPAGLLLKVDAGETSITVRCYSSRLARRVETETGEPYDRRAPRTRVVAVSSRPPGSRTVVQEPGASGFSVDYTRRVWRGERLKRDERFHVEYDAKDGIVEVGPPRASREQPKRKPEPEPAPTS